METITTCRIQSCVNSVAVEGLMCLRCWAESRALTKALVTKKLRSMEKIDKEISMAVFGVNVFVFSGGIALLVLAVCGYLYNTGGN